MQNEPMVHGSCISGYQHKYVSSHWSLDMIVGSLKVFFLKLLHRLKLTDFIF